MKDAFGNELKVGDSVVYVHGRNHASKLRTGKITKIYTCGYRCCDTEECSVNKVPHILSSRVAKISQLNNRDVCD